VIDAADAIAKMKASTQALIETLEETFRMVSFKDQEQLQQKSSEKGLRLHVLC
jgi:hypothetical protein